MSNESTEQTLYGIPLSEYENEGVRVNGGVYYDVKGLEFFIPDEVDNNTAAFVYFPGSGGSRNDAKLIREYINNGSPNQIIIITDNAVADRNTGGARQLQLIENIADYNDADITNIGVMGFSASGPTTFNTLSNLASTYPDNGPYAAVFCDVVGFNATEQQIQALANNESTLLFIEPNGKVPFEQELAKKGLDVIVTKVKSGHTDHVQLNREALGNDIINFLTGETDELANSDIYTFLKYDANTNSWYEIPLSEVADKFAAADILNNPYRFYDRLSNLDNELLCNNTFLGNKINTIRTAIKNSNFLSSMGSDTYSSTTQIPNAENEVVQAYFSSCAKMLNCLEKDTASIIEIGNSIKELNDGLSTDASQLNDTINYYDSSSSLSTYTNNSGSNNWANSSTSSSTSSVSNSTSSNISGNYSSSNTSGYTSGYSSSGTYVGGNTTITEQTTSSTESTSLPKVEEIKQEFLRYNNLYTSVENNMIVYKNTDNNSKIVIHYENDNILAIEHYYQYTTQDAAISGIEDLKEQYGVMCEDILNKTNTVKVVMDESTFSNMTLSQLKSEYSELKNMVELKKEVN